MILQCPVICFGWAEFLREQLARKHLARGLAWGAAAYQTGDVEGELVPGLHRGLCVCVRIFTRRPLCYSMNTNIAEPRNPQSCRRERVIHRLRPRSFAETNRRVPKVNAAPVQASVMRDTEAWASSYKARSAGRVEMNVWRKQTSTVRDGATLCLLLL